MMSDQTVHGCGELHNILCHGCSLAQAIKLPNQLLEFLTTKFGTNLSHKVIPIFGHNMRICPLKPKRYCSREVNHKSVDPEIPINPTHSKI
jgi:hypothetical protein